MGNCSFRAVADTAKGYNFIRVMTDSGEILHLKGPKLVREILDEFPGYNIFGQGHISSPLNGHQQLVSGKFYYLLPLPPFLPPPPPRSPHHPLPQQKSPAPSTTQNSGDHNGRSITRGESMRTSSSCAALEQLVTSLMDGSGVEVLPPPREGVWSVKLVIDPKQLGEILAEDVNTEALIEQMRMAANSASATPKRAKSSWGVSLKPIFNGPCKMPIDY